MPYILQTKQSIQNINVTSMIWYFVKTIDTYVCTYILLLHGTKNMEPEIWIFDYNSVILCQYFIFFIPSSILFLTLNYVCQTVYYKV